MNEKTPKIIYLQPDDDGETTWCEDQINDDDVAYVRQDVHEAVLREQTANTIEMIADRNAANHIIDQLRLACKAALETMNESARMTYAYDAYQMITAAIALAEKEGR